MSSSFLDVASLFVWSLWGEIGVPSPERRTIEMAIDLEPLIRLTKVVGARDPRLRSQTADWLNAFPELVSRARLKRIGGDVLKPSAGSNRAAMSGRVTSDLASASAVQLRIRSALGVSARAEIVRQLVLDVPRTRRSSSDLAQLCGYTKRNTEKALESLERGGWLMRIRGGASLRWSAVDHAALAGLFSPLPPSNASFMALAEIVEKIVALDDVGLERAQVRSASARQLLADVGATAHWGEVNLPEVRSAADAWDVTLAWAAGLPSTAL